MKTIIEKRVAISFLIAAFVCIMLSSFDSAPGGDSFTIYLNDKLLVQQFVHLKEKTKTISVQQASANDVIRVHYSHCGKMGIATITTIAIILAMDTKTRPVIKLLHLKIMITVNQNC